MLDKMDVAKFFLSLDVGNKVFNKNLVERNGRVFYEGNARLNKMMHLAQNIYLAKTGQLLVDAEFYAYDNGAVIPEVQESYGRLLAAEQVQENSGIPNDNKTFLKRIFCAFKDAPLDELIDIDHEDPEWKRKHQGFSKQEQKMDLLVHLEDYKKCYKDIIILLDKMVA